MNDQINECGAIWPSSPSLPAWSGCRDGRPTAFLTKTFQIVNDPDTNSVVSWGMLGNSFIIWDHLKFSAEILPKYFKHSNFSSFIYQLNNYGFRKIGVDHQWEYENKNFQAGKAHLLTNIRRRNQIPGRIIRQRCPKMHGKMISNGVEIGPEILEREIGKLMLEIEMLKRRQADMEIGIVEFEVELKGIESKQEMTIQHLAKALRAAMLARNMKLEAEEENDKGEDRKKRKLDAVDSPQKTNDQSVSLNDEYTFWKKILLEEEDFTCGTESGAEMENRQAKITLDLESLIQRQLPDQDT